MKLNLFSGKKNQSPDTPKEIREESPYFLARQEWLERYGDYIKSSSNWRLMALLAILGFILSLGMNIFQVQQTKITPYIVEVDKLGNAAAVRPLADTGEVPKRLVQSEIVNIITQWRTVTADLDLQKKFVGKLAAYIGGSAQGMLREWFNENNPYQRAQSILVSVDVTGVPLPVSSTSWRVSWRETTRNHSGTTLDVTTYEATVSIVIVPPKDETQIIANPGGILITSLSFGKVLNHGS